MAIYKPLPGYLKGILKTPVIKAKTSLQSEVKKVRAHAKEAGLSELQKKMVVKTIRRGELPSRRIGRLTMKALRATGDLKKPYAKNLAAGIRKWQSATEDETAATKPTSPAHSLFGPKKEESPAARRIRASRVSELRADERAQWEQERGIVRSVADRGVTIAHSAGAPIRSLGEQNLEAAAVSMGEVAAREREAERATADKGESEPEAPVEMLID